MEYQIQIVNTMHTQSLEINTNTHSRKNVMMLNTSIVGGVLLIPLTKLCPHRLLHSLFNASNKIAVTITPRKHCARRQSLI